MNLRDRLKRTEHRRAMHAAIARLDLVMETRAEEGLRLVAPDNNHTVWRTQMHLTTVKTSQNIKRVSRGK